MRNKRRIRFSNYVIFEILRRLLEMLGLGAIISLLHRVISATDLFGVNTFSVSSIISCGIFQAINIWLCRRSNSRMYHYRPDYYLSNLAGCLLHGMVGLFCLFLNPQWFLYFFSIAICLTREQQLNLHEIIATYACFFLLTAVITVLTKELKYIFRMVIKEK